MEDEDEEVAMRAKVALEKAKKARKEKARKGRKGKRGFVHRVSNAAPDVLCLSRGESSIYLSVYPSTCLSIFRTLTHRVTNFT